MGDTLFYIGLVVGFLAFVYLVFFHKSKGVRLVVPKKKDSDKT